MSWLHTNNGKNVEEKIEESVENDDTIVVDNIVHVNCAIEDIDDSIRVDAQDNLKEKKRQNISYLKEIMMIIM